MLFDGFWLPLLLKLAATVAVVIGATLLAERAGPFWGGLMCAFPLSSGPAYVLLAMQSEPAFVAASALTTLAGTSATTLYMLGLVRLAPRFAIVPTLLLSTIVWIVAALLIHPIEWTLPTALALAMATIVLCCLVTRDCLSAGAPREAPQSWIDLPIRAFVIGLTVATVVSISQMIGPEWTGLLISFPVTLTSFAIMLHTRQGGRALSATMAQALRAMPGFVMAVMTVHLVVPLQGSTIGLLCALGASAAYAIGMMFWRPRPAPAAALR
jgi:hypothetical protein